VLLLQALVAAVTAVLNNTPMQQRAKEVAASIAKEYSGVKAAADIVLKATEPWSKLSKGTS
jgi:UDP:flavonoid glycosyltransferase YjiC (YdhE family)